MIHNGFYKLKNLTCSDITLYSDWFIILCCIKPYLLYTWIDIKLDAFWEQNIYFRLYQNPLAYSDFLPGFPDFPSRPVGLHSGRRGRKVRPRRRPPIPPGLPAEFNQRPDNSRKLKVYLHVRFRSPVLKSIAIRIKIIFPKCVSFVFV